MSNNKDFKVKNGIQPTVYHEAVGTVVSDSVGYAVSNGTYDSKSFATTAQENAPHGISIKPDGTKLFVLGNGGDDVGEYTLSTAYDISTASFVDSFSVSTQLSLPRGLFFKPDGTKFYAVGTSTDKVFQYSMTTAWDVSTASYESKEFLVSSQETSPFGLSFKTDGTKMYVLGMTSRSVFQYTLSTAWDVSTASYDSVSYSVSSLGTLPVCVVFNSTGTEMYTTSADNAQFVRIHTLTTAWDISTASHTGSLDTSGDVTASQIGGLVFANSGQKMYFSQQNNDTIYQYSTVLTTASLDLSTGSVFEVTPTSDIQVTLTNPAASGTSSGATLLLDQQGYGGYDVANGSYDNISLSIAGQETQGQGLTFKSDGTKLYVIGTNGDDVNEYDLSTAWNVSTATYLQNFSISAQEIGPTDITFKIDGTEMYVVGANGDEVNQFTLSTAWDISTASYSGTFSVATQETAPSGIFFKSDGTRMYITGYAGDDVNEYNLSTAWNISTASFVQLFSVAAQEASPQSLSFSSDGTKMFVLGESGLDVNFYSLSTAWNISTASFSSAFALTAGEVAVRGLAFSNDGSKMYILDEDDETIHQYSTATPATITYDSTLQWSGGTAPTSPAIGETDVLTFNTTDGGTTYQAVQAISGAK